MRLSHSLSYAADPATVFAMFSDSAWREEVCRQMHAVSWTIDLDDSADQLSVTTTRVIPADVPAQVKAMVGNQITVVQSERWTPPAADGSRTAELSIDVRGQPADLRGSLTLHPTPEGSTELLDGEVTVRIPFLGKRFEPMIADTIAAALRKEGEVGASYLAAR